MIVTRGYGPETNLIITKGFGIYEIVPEVFEVPCILRARTYPELEGVIEAEKREGEIIETSERIPSITKAPERKSDIIEAPERKPEIIRAPQRRPDVVDVRKPKPDIIEIE